MGRCLFCGGGDGLLSIEHVLPRWVRKAFDQRGAATLYAGESPGERARRKVAKIHHLRLTLNEQICQDCNNGPLSRMENAVREFLGPMAASATPTTLDPHRQEVLATWAVKTVLLLELAWRQHYPGTRPIEGYLASDAEFAWLFSQATPPPRSLVWIGCWDCKQTSPIMYEPSGAPLPTADGAHVAGHFTSFTLGFVGFQVFTVDFVAADEHQASAWNGRVPASLAHALVRIWPRPRGAIQWPPAAFGSSDWNRLVTWDGLLRATNVR